MTEKEKLCVHEWVSNGFNGTRAYLAVFKSCKNEKSAAVLFNSIMKKPSVREYRDKLMKELEDVGVASATEVMLYLTRVMRGEEKDAFGLDPSLEERTKAAEKLMKAKGMFTQKVEVTNETENEKVKAISNIEALVKQMRPIGEDEISE